MIVTLIAAGIVLGLTYMVVELLQADQRESSLTETQRDMQSSLNYISDEMKQAVYIYSGECLIGNGAAGGDPCHGLYPYIPTALTSNGTVPILAFWKQEPYPEIVRENVCNSSAAVADIACINGSSYALIVYALKKKGTNDIWDGRARIIRYALTEFDESGNRVPGYVNPGQFGNNFVSWPYGSIEGAAAANQQAQRPTGAGAVLADFVDDGSGGLALGLAATTPTCPNNPATPTVDYALSPTFAAFSSAFPGVPMSFYACVGSGVSTTAAGGSYLAGSTIGDNGETILYLRGNAAGKPGVRNNTGLQAGARSERGLPTIQTRVLSRSVLSKDPETQ